MFVPSVARYRARLDLTAASRNGDMRKGRAPNLCVSMSAAPIRCGSSSHRPPTGAENANRAAGRSGERGNRPVRAQRLARGGVNGLQSAAVASASPISDEERQLPNERNPIFFARCRPVFQALGSTRRRGRALPQGVSAAPAERCPSSCKKRLPL
jgi:hypothetical protein